MDQREVAVSSAHRVTRGQRYVTAREARALQQETRLLPDGNRTACFMVYWRPTGEINLKDPDSDLCLVEEV